MTNQEIESQLTKRQRDLPLWVAKLSKSRKAGKIATRGKQVQWHKGEIARLQGILFARHCNEQV